MADAQPKKMTFLQQVASLPANFWYANLMEIIERLAFFGVRAIAPLYLVAKSGDNGLALTYTQKGTIYGVWALIQCLVPMVSGGYTERYGYRRSLAVAFVINIVGYLCMAQSKPVSDMLIGQGWAGASYWVFMFAACCVALGTAIFKPPCHGTVAKTTDENTSSMGWGLFYWVVNIGGALAPMAAAELRGEIDWHYVFYAAAIVTALNFLPLFILYREPEKTPPKEGEEQKNAFQVFYHSIATILKDMRLVVFLLIFSCFWLMFMQLWDLLPNFIDEWVDTATLAPYFGWFSDGWVLPNGQVKPEMLINIDSLAIIALVLIVSWLIRKINKVAAMIIGMLISLVGFVGAGATTMGWICCLMIFIFAIGEMTCSPTFSAYISLIAPKDKKALYMGYSNIPFAIGWAVGNLVGGYFYDHNGAKAELAFKQLATETQLVSQAARAVDWSDSLERIPTLLEIERDEAFALAQQEMGLDATAAAEQLRADFRYDRGQIVNLALLYLDDADVADKGRDEALDAVRDMVNKDVPKAKRQQDGVIMAMLWEQYGDDPDVLNNLALEYLAQSTDLLSDALANMQYEHTPDQIDERKVEITERIGLDKSKAFHALSAAIGHDTAAVDAEIAALDLLNATDAERVFIYLAKHGEHRYQAVRDMDWKHNRQLLRTLIRDDDTARQIVLDEIDEVGLMERAVSGVRLLCGAEDEVGVVTEEGVNYHKLATKNDLIQKALSAKDWTESPLGAVQLLAMNPSEARALAASDRDAAKQVLWDTYHPYMVWVYLGAFGLAGTIGMIIFYLATRKAIAAQIKAAAK